MYLLQQLLNGICQGSIYALMAMGYTMIYGVVGLVSFSYGELIMIGAFGAYYTFLTTGNLLLGIVAGSLAAAMLGIVLYFFCYRRFLEAPRHIAMICTFAFSMLAKNMAQIFFGSQTKPVPAVFENQTYTIAGLRITNLQLIIMAVVIVCVLVFSFFLTKTRTGTMLRAVSQNKKASALMGINVKSTVMAGNCLGCALGGIAGVLLCIYYASVYPTMGAIVGTKAMTATVMGGLVSISGSALSGLVIGIMENLSVIVIPVALRDAVSFVFLVLVLLIKPTGFVMKRRASK